MYSTETEIHDQAYQFFKQEAPEFLQTIETGLLCLREDRSTNNIHSIMRAAHSIKGGSASLGLEGIKTVAHQLEDVFRSLYRFEGEIDADVEGLLFQAYDCLRLPLMEQLQSGQYDSAAAIAAAEPIFEVLKLYLGDTDEDVELPTAAELGVDIVQIVFEGDVQQGLTRLQSVLANPDGVPVAGEIRAQIEVFSGIGELLNLSGFKAIAHATLQALEHNSDNPILVGQVAVANFEAARAEVLAGDRAQGGQPSPELIALTKSHSQANQSPFSQTETIPTSTIDLMEEDPFEADFDNADDWFQSLEDELNEIKFPDPNSELALEAQIDLTPNPNSELALESQIDLTPDNFFNDSLEGELDLFADNQEFDRFDDVEFISSDNHADLGETKVESDAFDLDIDNLDQGFDIFSETLEEKDQNFDIFAETLGEDLNNFIEIEPSEGGNEVDEVSDISELSNFFEPQESSLTNRSSSQLAETTSQVPKSISSNYITQEAISPSKNVIPSIAETIRVAIPRLDRLNNYSSELVTQENASILQNQQLQAKIERIQKQFKGFDQLSKSLQTWLDKAQRSQVKTQELTQKLTVEPSPTDDDNTNDIYSPSTNLLADFDPLLMDSYSHLHTFIQEALEDIAQMDEGMRDMTVLMQQTQQTQRRKQQILKQVRYDLLWSRMLPLGDILSSLPRMVREMSNKYNKQVNLKLFGTGTLVDKSILEKLYDPFVHLVRNAFDHGTESAQNRLDRGKPLIASIEIRAYYRGNQTYIEIKDDGQGINLDKVKAKALASGLLSSDKAKQITDDEVYQFLFEPNFSTAVAVSDLSGRGMGLSTVLEQVRSLKGAIEVKSELGQGTTFTIRLPLTLSIAKLMIFSIQERLLAIAIDSLLGIITVDSDEIQIIQGNEFYRFEDRLVPLYPTSLFADGYPLPKQSLDMFNPESFTEENQITLLLFSDGEQVVALPIDRVLNEQELAIKPFGKAITPPPYLYGCTVLGNGTLVPVIDSSVLLSIRQSTRSLLSASPSTDSPTTPPLLAAKLDAPKRKTILIVDDSLTVRQALYLTLEKFGYQVIQAGDGREAIEKLARSSEIQAVLCDVEMPNMNGFEFLAACRKDSRYLDIPIVMITSRSGTKHRGVAQMLGASGYLTKPYLEQELIKTIQGLTV
jgi:two-component system, chemotaxis family, sensor histidine kinase and response regulator PixL